MYESELSVRRFRRRRARESSFIFIAGHDHEILMHSTCIFAHLQQIHSEMLTVTQTTARVNSRYNFKLGPDDSREPCVRGARPRSSLEVELDCPVRDALHAAARLTWQKWLYRIYQ